jgi:hypothetical protein
MNFCCIDEMLGTIRLVYGFLWLKLPRLKAPFMEIVQELPNESSSMRPCVCESSLKSWKSTSFPWFATFFPNCPWMSSKWPTSRVVLSEIPSPEKKKKNGIVPEIWFFENGTVPQSYRSPRNFNFNSKWQHGNYNLNCPQCGLQKRYDAVHPNSA